MHRTEWGSPPAGIAGIGVAGVLMAVGSLTVADDPAGRILTGIAAVGLVVFAACELLPDTSC